jgi:ribonuclease P protein component
MTPATLDRLRDGRDVAAVLRSRGQRAGRLVVVHARRRDDQGPCRVAVVASRRIGNAVSRNRAKRLLREGARQVGWAHGLDVVLVARAAAASSTSPAVAAEVEELAAAMSLTTDERASSLAPAGRAGS